MQNKTDNQVYAGFFVRLAAYLIDSIIVGMILAVVVRFPVWISTLISPNNIVVRDFIFEYSIKDIVIYLLGAVYFIVLTYKTGATIGKKIMHIQVVSAEEREMTLFEVIYRETVGRFLSALIIYAGYFLIGLQKEKRGLHDLMADTKVVYCHKKDVVVETPVVYREIPNNYVVNSYVRNPVPADIVGQPEEVEMVGEAATLETEEEI